MKVKVDFYYMNTSYNPNCEYNVINLLSRGTREQYYRLYRE